MNINGPYNFKILPCAISAETVNVAANHNSSMIDSTRSTIEMNSPSMHYCDPRSLLKLTISNQHRIIYFHFTVY